MPSRFNSHLTEEMEEGCSEEAILTDAKREENRKALKAIFPGIYFEFTHTLGKDGRYDERSEA